MVFVFVIVGTDELFSLILMVCVCFPFDSDVDEE